MKHSTKLPDVQSNHPKLSTLVDLPKMAFLELGDTPSFKISLYIWKINSDLYETLNLCSQLGKLK